MTKNALWARRVLTVSLICGVLYVAVIKPAVTNHCLEKYGTELNPYRVKLGIPILLDSWKLYGKEETFTAWQPKSVTTGHVFKEIVYTGCNLDSERDDYLLSPKNRKQRTIQMTYKYKKNTGSDSLIIIYQIDQDWKYISKEQMDSILDAEKIKKDY